jgi:hypothetical protein
LQLAPRDLQRWPMAEHGQEVLAQYPRALGAALLVVQHFLDVLVHQIRERVGRLALRHALARSLRFLLSLFELGVFPLVAFQPLL